MLPFRSDLVQLGVGTDRAVVEQHERSDATGAGEVDGIGHGRVSVGVGQLTLRLHELRVVEQNVDIVDEVADLVTHSSGDEVVRHVRHRPHVITDPEAERATTLVPHVGRPDS